MALTSAVAASPVPSAARAAGQQARFTGQWALTQGAFSAFGMGGRGSTGGRRAATPMGRPPGGGGPGPAAPGAGPSGPPVLRAQLARRAWLARPARLARVVAGSRGGWVPPVTRVRGGRP